MEEKEIKVEEKRTDGDGKATASLVLGIISVVISFFGLGAIVSIVLSILGIIFSSSAKKMGCKNEGSATAGLVLSIIGLVISLFMLLIVGLVLGALGLAIFTC